MANTYTALHFHFVFSTKNRMRWIGPQIEKRHWKYMGGIARENKIKPLKIGGIEDHVHLLLGLPPTITVSKTAQLIKGGSSAWIHDTFPDLAGFAWQDGYSAFTVSRSHVPDVSLYIGSQREHHRRRSYKEELLAQLEKHEIDYDEKHLWT